MKTLTSSQTSKSARVEIAERHSATVNMKQVASLILSGGEGTRLFPLTLTRSKPAINFGGKYRLIDVPISNSIHAGCQKIFVLTQYLSSSLHHHIFQTYLQGGANSGLIEVLTAEQTPSNQSWFQGTADAVRQNIQYLLETPVEYFLILSGDQLYNIDFTDMVRFAKETDSDVLVPTLPVNAQDASRLGILKIDSTYTITDFIEKPQEKEQLAKLKTPTETLEKTGIFPASRRYYLGSMGIYLFKRKALIDILKNDTREDFGKHLIPTLVKERRVKAYLYDGYWEDIGTIESFYQANMSLTHPKPAFNFFQENRPIYSSKFDLPPTKYFDTHIKQSILCDGGVIEADEITRSILGPRTMVQRGSIIRDSYIMGNDYYASSVTDLPSLPPNPQIGENCIIKKAIIDKNVFIGKGVQLINKQKLSFYNSDHLYIRDGIIIVPRGATLPDGFTI